MFQVMCALLLAGVVPGDSETEARALLLLSSAAQAQQQPVPPVERELSIPTPVKRKPAPKPAHVPGGLTYAEAYQRAIELKRPLIVWIGGNFCERCVNDSKEEFVHFFADEWDGQKGPATAVYAYYDDGLYRAATVEKWTVGSHDWGHIPSARRVLSEWYGAAKQGVYGPLRLLNFGDGHWGMSHDMFYRNLRGGYSGSRGTTSVTRSTPAIRTAGSSGGSNC